MDFLEAINKSIKPLSDLGFSLISKMDQGMGKICILGFSNFQVAFIYDRGPVHCDLKYINEETKYEFDLIHLLNYLNKEKCKYKHPNYYFDLQQESSELYIDYYIKAIQENIDKINHYFILMSDQEYKKFEKYYLKENMKRWK